MFQFDLSLTELDIVGEALALDVRQFPFAFGYTGEDETERLEAAVATGEACERRGYVKDGQLVRDVQNGLSVYSLGQPSISVMGQGARGQLLARASAVDPTGVLAQQDGDRMYFAVGGPDDIVPGVLNLLPQHKRGSGNTVTIPGDKPAEPGSSDDDFTNISYTSGPTGMKSREEEAVVRMIGTGWLGGGSILVEAAGPHDEPGTSLTLDWFDTESGRYIGYSTFATDGREHIVYTPADLAHMGRILHDFLQKVRR